MWPQLGPIRNLFYLTCVGNITVWLLAVLSGLRVLFPWKLPSWDNCGMLSSKALSPGLDTRAASVSKWPTGSEPPGKNSHPFPLKWSKQQSFSLSQMNKTGFPRFTPQQSSPARHCLFHMHVSGDWSHRGQGCISPKRSADAEEAFKVWTALCLKCLSSPERGTEPGTKSVPNKCLWSSVLGDGVIRERNGTLESKLGLLEPHCLDSSLLCLFTSCLLPLWSSSFFCSKYCSNLSRIGRKRWYLQLCPVGVALLRINIQCDLLQVTSIWSQIPRFQQCCSYFGPQTTHTWITLNLLKKRKLPSSGH